MHHNHLNCIMYVSVTRCCRDEILDRPNESSNCICVCITFFCYIFRFYFFFLSLIIVCVFFFLIFPGQFFLCHADILIDATAIVSAFVWSKFTSDINLGTNELLKSWKHCVYSCACICYSSIFFLFIYSFFDRLNSSRCIRYVYSVRPKYKTKYSWQIRTKFIVYV